MLYADVRGSTELAARLGPTEFAALMQRFFQTAIKVFTWTDAIVDKMVGDEVIGIYVPCLTGDDYRKQAVAAGLSFCAPPATAILPVRGSRSASACIPARHSWARSASRAATISSLPLAPL